MAILITDMDIEGSTNCISDYLEIRDGSNEDSPSMGRFCGDLSARYTTFIDNFFHRFFSHIFCYENCVGVKTS
jgi:hypothetical protein